MKWTKRNSSDTKDQESDYISFLNNTVSLKTLESNVFKYWILCLDSLSVKYKSRIKFDFRKAGSQKLPSCTLSLKDIGGCAPLKHGRTRKNQERDSLKTKKTEWSQEEKVQKCSGGCTDALWKQKRLTLNMRGNHVSFRGLLISFSLLLCQISTSPLRQSNYLQKLETL